MESSARSKNLTWHAGSVSPRTRRRLLGQRGCVVWPTGLSGSGKSTIAFALEKQLARLGRPAYVLDGDNIRHGLNADLGFSPCDREENLRRVGQVAALFADAGLLAIAAFVSPYRAARARARQAVDQAVGAGRFAEVFCDAPLAVCQRRDPKGLYRKARAGRLKGLTGVDAPYEPPRSADLTLDTAGTTVRECVSAVIELLVNRRLIPPAGRRPRGGPSQGRPS